MVTILYFDWHASLLRENWRSVNILTAEVACRLHLNYLWIGERCNRREIDWTFTITHSVASLKSIVGAAESTWYLVYLSCSFHGTMRILGHHLWTGTLMDGVLARHWQRLIVLRSHLCVCLVSLLNILHKRLLKELVLANFSTALRSCVHCVEVLAKWRKRATSSVYSDRGNLTWGRWVLSHLQSCSCSLNTCNINSRQTWRPVFIVAIVQRVRIVNCIGITIARCIVSDDLWSTDWVASLTSCLLQHFLLMTQVTLLKRLKFLFEVHAGSLRLLREVHMVDRDGIIYLNLGVTISRCLCCERRASSIWHRRHILLLYSVMSLTCRRVFHKHAGVLSCLRHRRFRLSRVVGCIHAAS